MIPNSSSKRNEIVRSDTTVSKKDKKSNSENWEEGDYEQEKKTNNENYKIRDNKDLNNKLTKNMTTKARKEQSWK